ncbi:recombinase family protein [Halocatena halophila]|uniref:recombinase family protein n=1 Tax=Halocatena halophila TaxID=2814576 RepID=UPI002ED05F9A
MICDLDGDGATTSRTEYQHLREHVTEYDVVVTHELNRLCWSFTDLAGFVEELSENGIDPVN